MAENGCPRIVIAGGGVAGLEACLALRSFLGEDELAIDLIARDDRFEYRPLSVLEPFEDAPAWSMELARFARDQDVQLVHDTLAAVDPARQAATTTHSGELPYDALLVAVGTRATTRLRGAVTFRGRRDAEALRAALDAVDPGARVSVAFAVPFGVFWSLPLYELAVLAAARLHARGARARVVLASPETAPMEAFGARASAAVGTLLDEHGIEYVGSVRPVAADAGALELDDGGRIEASTIVALPGATGRRIAGLPQDGARFVPVDEHGRVRGLDDVYAAGDITTFPLKQGGLATQQADAAAEAILAGLGMPIVPRPFEPVLRGVLYTDGAPAYLRSAQRGDSSEPRAYSMWWPPSKIAGRHLAPYLTTRAGMPRAPEQRPEREGMSVNVDIARAAAVQG
jgi:sulfide:quinone oxidoreductase